VNGPTSSWCRGPAGPGRRRGRGHIQDHHAVDDVHDAVGGLVVGSGGLCVAAGLVMPALSRARHGQRLGEAALVDAVAEHLRADARRAKSVLGEAVAAAEDGEGSPCRVCCGVELAGRAGGGEHLRLPWAKNMMETLPARRARLLQTSWPPDAVRATRCCPLPPRCYSTVVFSWLKKDLSAQFNFTRVDLFINTRRSDGGCITEVGRSSICVLLRKFGPAYIASS